MAIKNAGRGTPKYNEGMIISGSIDGLNNFSLQTEHNVEIGGDAYVAKDIFVYNEPVYGGVNYIEHGLIQNPTPQNGSTPARVYFPMDDYVNETYNPANINFYIAPFDGAIKQIQVRSNLMSLMTSLTMSLHKGTDGNNAYSSTPSYSVTKSVGTNNTTYTFDFDPSDSGCQIKAGDIFGIGMIGNKAWDSSGNWHMTAVFTYYP
jgi:hypothetical protein